MHRRRGHHRCHPHRHDRDAVVVFTITYRIIVVTMLSAASSAVITSSLCRLCHCHNDNNVFVVVANSINKTSLLL